MHRISREVRRVSGDDADSLPRTHKQRSTPSPYQKARGRLHRLSTGSPWVRYGFNAVVVFFILLVVRQMHRGMCEADQLSSSLDPKTKGEYEAKLAMLEKELENQVVLRGKADAAVKDWTQGHGLGNQMGEPDDRVAGIGMSVQDLQELLKEAHEKFGEKVKEVDELENVNNALEEQVENLRQQIDQRRKLDRDLDGQGRVERRQDIVGTGTAGGVSSPSKGSPKHRYGKQTASNRIGDADKSEAVEAEATVVARGDSTEEDVGEGGNDPDISNGGGDGSGDAVDQDKAISSANPIPISIPELNDAEGVDGFDFEVKEEIDVEEVKREKREAQNNDRPGGKTRKPTPFLKKPAKDLTEDPAEHGGDHQGDVDREQTGGLPEVDSGMAGAEGAIEEKDEGKQPPSSSADGPPEGGPANPSEERTQASNSAGPDDQRPQEGHEGAPSAEGGGKENVKRVADAASVVNEDEARVAKESEVEPVEEDEGQEGEGVPKGNENDGSNPIVREGEKENVTEIAPGDVGEPENKLEAALSAAEGAADLLIIEGESEENPSQDAVKIAVFGTAQEGMERHELELDAAEELKVKLDDLQKEPSSTDDGAEEVSEEGGVQQKEEAVKEGKIEDADAQKSQKDQGSKDGELALEEALVALQQEPSSTDEEQEHTSSSISERNGAVDGDGGSGEQEALVEEAVDRR